MRACRSPSPCLSVVLILASVLGFPVAIGAAEQPRRGRPIEFSDPKGTEITTNFNSLRSNRGLREIEEDLSKFLPRTFSPGSSLDGVEAPPLRIVPPPNMSNKRAKEARDRRVNWVWQNPQELTKGPKAEELFKLPEYGPDGKEKKNKTDSFESFYERLGRERHSDIEHERERDDDPTEPDKTRAISLEDLKPKAEDTVAKPVNEGERVLRRLFDSQPTESAVASDSARTSASDIFGLGNSTPSPDQLESHKMLQKQFESLYSTVSAASSITELQNSLGGALAPVRQSDSFTSPTKSGFEPTLGTISAPFTGSAVPDMNFKDFNSWSSPAAAPRIELPKMPTTSIFDIPRRKF